MICARLEAVSGTSSPLSQRSRDLKWAWTASRQERRIIVLRVRVIRFNARKVTPTTRSSHLTSTRSLDSTLRLRTHKMHWRPKKVPVRRASTTASLSNRNRHSRAALCLMLTRAAIWIPKVGSIKIGKMSMRASGTERHPTSLWRPATAWFIRVASSSSEPIRYDWYELVMYGSISI